MNKRTPALYIGETINTVEQKQSLQSLLSRCCGRKLLSIIQERRNPIKILYFTHEFFSGANCFITGPGVRKKMRQKIKLPQVFAQQDDLFANKRLLKVHISYCVYHVGIGRKLQKNDLFLWNAECRIVKFGRILTIPKLQIKKIFILLRHSPTEICTRYRNVRYRRQTGFKISRKYTI